MKKNKLFFYLFITPLIIVLISFFYFPKKAIASDLPFKLRGQFLLQVEDKGQAWYVDTLNGARYFISSPESSNQFLQQFGLGVKNSDLAKIPIAVDARLITQDSDGDGLDNRLEIALGTDPFIADSDGDSHPDGLELTHHFNPLGPGRLELDLDFAKRLRGRILLQVESKGEAWYVDPVNYQRYYIPDGQALFKIITILGQGISDNNLDLIANGSLLTGPGRKSIKIDVSSSQRLFYYLDDVLLGSFSISAGKIITPTPKGEFKIINKHLKAWSPFGLWMPYWLGLGTGRFGIHELPIWPSGYREGTDHLGVAVSHGCIRLGIGPAQYIYNWVNIGTPVTIY